MFVVFSDMFELFDSLQQRIVFSILFSDILIIWEHAVDRRHFSILISKYMQTSAGFVTSLLLLYILCFSSKESFFFNKTIHFNGEEMESGNLSFAVQC
jgi:hypothetical protein